MERFVIAGNHDVVNELLLNNADTNMPDESEKTLMDLATSKSN